MIVFAADEDFDNDILRALQRRLPGIDIIRVQDVGLSGYDDPTVLEWAANNGRILLTHDISTMTRHTLERVRAGLAMPGVIAVPQRINIGRVLDDLALVVTCGDPQDLSGRLLYLPLR